jgi:hypothetical protein
MVCGATLPPPPPNAASVDSSLPADATERTRANFRESRSDCNPCHGRFDPLGLLTERYDPLGRYVAMDAAGQPIDQTSTIKLGNDLDGPANGLPELITRLKSSRQFADCASGMLANISLGRPVTTESSCALRKVQDGFAANQSFMVYSSRSRPRPPSPCATASFNDRKASMNPMTSPRFGRRMLLGGGIGAGLASLFLRPLEAAAAVGPPTRFLLVHKPCGTVLNRFFPTAGTSTSFTLGPITAPFEPLKGDMVILDNVTAPRDGGWQGDRHGAASSA